MMQHSKINKIKFSYNNPEKEHKVIMTSSLIITPNHQDNLFVSTNQPPKSIHLHEMTKAQKPIILKHSNTLKSSSPTFV